jgi:transcriptional regulator with XRE-family HTH domain
LAKTSKIKLPDQALPGSWRRIMKKAKVRTFRNRLREDLKDPEFKAHYQEERQAVSRIESGEYEGFTLKTLEKIAEATGTKVKIEFVAA